MIERLQLMMKKSDPHLLERLLLRRGLNNILYAIGELHQALLEQIGQAEAVRHHVESAPSHVHQQAPMPGAHARVREAHHEREGVCKLVNRAFELQKGEVSVHLLG